jgi:hypothetical protein
MDNPHTPPSFEPQQPEGSGGINWPLLIWGIIAAVGALIVLLMSCALFGLVILPRITEGDIGSALLEEQAAPTLPPPPESPRHTERSVPAGPVLLEEDFEEASPRWDQAAAQVMDGAYELHLDTPNSDSYGLFLGAAGVRDFDIAVDAQQIAGDPTAEYGIRFRQSGPQDYLMFSLSSAGYYRLVSVSDGDYESIVPWTAHPDIDTAPEAVNRLRVVAQGEDITASVNGDEVLQVTDEVGERGQFTLGLATFDEGNLRVRFDNMEGSIEGMALQEDFSEPEQVAWSISGARILEEAGMYELFAGAGLQSWQQPLPRSAFEVANFSAEVEVTTIEAGENTAYGLIFGDGGNFDFYTLLILPDGSLMLLRNEPEGETVLLPPSRLDIIETGPDATNTLGVEIRNDTLLTITINGEELPTVESPVPFEEGMVGMIVSSGEASRVQVQFDNFYLEELVEGEEA